MHLHLLKQFYTCTDNQEADVMSYEVCKTIFKLNTKMNFKTLHLAKK